MIVVCWKWVGGDGDERSAGTSDADRAALEVGLRLAEASGDAVTVVTVGPTAAEHALRTALAAGAAHVVRVDAPAGLASAAVAAAVAGVAATARWIVCGDVSADRGTGAMPAYLAAELGAAQALGLVGVSPPSADDGLVRAVRRLDGGRREVLDVAAPAVLSVEASVTRLRRAGLPSELAARTADIERVVGPAGPLEQADIVRPYRPRARALAAPAGPPLERVRLLTDAGGTSTRPRAEIVTLDPPDAARRILDVLADWGYLPG